MIGIVGESASGKTSLAKLMCEKFPHQFRRAIAYTTRPIREGEREGVDYHFVTPEKFDELKASGFFIESNTYRNWQYGTAWEDCVDENNVVAVLNPAGLRLIRGQGVNVLAIYLYVDRRSRMHMLLNRGDDVDEAYRRNLSDVGEFDGIENEVDYIIDNTEYHGDESAVLTCMLGILESAEAENEKD